MKVKRTLWAIVSNRQRISMTGFNVMETSRTRYGVVNRAFHELCRFGMWGGDRKQHEKDGVAPYPAFDKNNICTSKACLWVSMNIPCQLTRFPVEFEVTKPKRMRRNSVYLEVKNPSKKKRKKK